MVGRHGLYNRHVKIHVHLRQLVRQMEKKCRAQGIALVHTDVGSIGGKLGG